MGIKLERLRAGDIVLQAEYGNPGHAVLWIDPEKAIAHSAEGNINAVVRNYVSDVFRNSDASHVQGRSYWVYRHDDVKVGPLAAKFATLWCSSEKDQPSPSGITMPYGKSRFHEGKYLHSVDLKDDWDVMALFHAARAYAKAKHEKPLSNKGVSCDQFAVYCYQCASIEAKLGPDKVNSKVLEGMMQHDSQIALRNDTNVHRLKLTALEEFRNFNRPWKPDNDKAGKNTALNLLTQAFGEHKDPASFGKAIGLTEGLMFDAKYASIGYMTERLNAKDSGFTRVGFAIPYLDAGGVKRDDLFLLPHALASQDILKKPIKELLDAKVFDRPA